MKIERAWLRIVVSVIVGGIAGVAFLLVSIVVVGVAGQFSFLAGPTATAVLLHMLTPKERLDGETRCRKCGYILKGLTEPRCSECGERI